MDFTGFSSEDFAIFALPGFEERMQAIKESIRPKLIALGEVLAPALSAKTGRSFYTHVASHARRSVNPPDDTWLALGRSPRGYKMYVHFAVGIALDHVYVQLILKPESLDKLAFTQALETQGQQLLQPLRNMELTWYGLPKRLGESRAVDEINDSLLHQVVEDLRERKSSWTAIGKNIAQDNLILEKPSDFIPWAEDTLLTLMPLYQAALSRALAGTL